jgi:serine/threonine protein phosphatase 1
MKKRILVISDIHGMYDHFCKLLQKVKYDPTKDQLVLLGDYGDRGPKTKEVYELVKSLVSEHGAVALRGNHDNMFLDFIDGVDYATFMYNGGLQTLESYFGTDWNIYDEGIIDKIRAFITKHYAHHIDFIRNLPYHHETDLYIFVHAGLNPSYEDWKNTPDQEKIWIRDLFHNHQTQTDKTVIFGHTPCLNLHGKEDVWFGGDKIGIDGAAAYGFQLNCLEITDEGYKQYSVGKEDV